MFFDKKQSKHPTKPKIINKTQYKKRQPEINGLRFKKKFLKTQTRILKKPFKPIKPALALLNLIAHIERK